MLVFKIIIITLHPQSQINMIKRKADELIRNFILHDKRSLLVTGARQVGKTFSIRKVGKECFDNVVEINFIEQPDAIHLFGEQKGAKDLLLRLSAFTKKPLVPGKTLIFFDEVQECKEIVTAIKFLVDEGSYKYVMSGSLLGVELDDLRSVPVGYMDEIEMYPLDLLEFFEAIGIGTDVIEHLRKRLFGCILSLAVCLQQYKSILIQTICVEFMKNSVVLSAPTKGISQNMTTAISCR